tara:strand:- start:684 stop:1052 length:369 start_codon:yes stop_codon:yes gene_type:complete
MANTLELKIESVSPRAEGYADYDEFIEYHTLRDDTAGVQIFKKLKTLTDDSHISSSVGFKPSDENATYHRITFQDDNYLNEVKELIESISAWDMVTTTVITSDAYDTKLGSGEAIKMHSWRD